MNKPFYLVPICDTHIGSPRTQYKRLKKWISVVADRDDVFAFGLGDLCDLIGHMDPRYTTSVIDVDKFGGPHSFGSRQTEMAVDFLRPLVGKLGFVTQGNHEHSLAKRGVLDPHEMMLKQLNAKESKEWIPGDAPMDGGMSFMLRVILERGLEKRVFTVYGHHGYFGGQTPNKVRRLIAMCRLWDVDLVVVGHGHTPVDTGPIERLRPNQRWTDLDSKPGRGVMCCAWKNNLSQDVISWEETRGFEPSVTGPTLIKMQPGARLLRPLFGKEAELEFSQ
jgi:hypothetical protein